MTTLRVLDGDGIEYGDWQYRLAFFDAPEVRNLRSRVDQTREYIRGEQAKLRLETLIAGARSVHLINWGTPAPPGRRYEATLLLNGWDVRTIALKERWGTNWTREGTHARVDWGDRNAPFDDGLPIPEHAVADLDDEHGKGRRRRYLKARG